MLETINVGVAVQSQGQGYKTKSDESIAPVKVSRIEDQKVRLDLHIKDDQRIKEKKNVDEEQKGKENAQVSQALLDDLENNINTIHNVGLEFSMHEESGRTMIKVVEKDTGDLIRQIPPEEVLDLISRVNDVLGIFFDKRV
ncbi:MAG: flagellar protein FlaG [Desulfobacterales bacterium]|nr:flagellar protein FlaG [Desulfobacterales bacterium]